MAKKRARAVRSGSRLGERRRDQAQEAHDTLRDLIVRGRLTPGSRLVEADLAERLGVSRTPIRTALVMLQQDGYATASGEGRQSRLSVAPLTTDDAYELYYIAAAVEGVAARWAAQVAEVRRERLVRELQALNEELAALARATSPDPNRIFEMDTGFHLAFVKASAGPRIMSLHQTIRFQIERYWRLYTSSIVGELSRSVGEHERIIDAFDRGDPDAAARSVEANWHTGAERLVKVIEALGERGRW